MGEDIMVPETFPVIDENVIIQNNSKYYLSDKLGIHIIIYIIIITILLSQS